jgi:tRNA (guanine37-N1)-methyltransferase
VGLLEYAQYTRPASFRGADVPAVLSGGNHAEIAKWRRAQAEEKTRARRPDLFARYEENERRLREEREKLRGRKS